MNPFHASSKTCKQGIRPGFETQGRRHQKSKTGISGLTKSISVLHKFEKTTTNNYSSSQIISIYFLLVVSLQDINMRKPFKSSVIKDQQAITITTRPQAIKDTYRNCNAPPPLDKLNPYRCVYNLRIYLNLSVQTSNQKINLSGLFFH